MSLPLLELSDGVIIGLCAIGWTAWSVLVGFIAHRLPLKLLEMDTWLTRPCIWENDRYWYDRVLQIKHWKDRLPEAGDFFPGGMSKSSMGGRDCAAMSRFSAETRRAEYVHVVIWLFWIVTMLWTPGWGVLLNLGFATAFNLPCWLVQRYNRLRLQNLLTLSRKSPVL
jgi:glycosyl-4,4'-diaponeurosporenoate acyltransferase